MRESHLPKVSIRKPITVFVCFLINVCFCLLVSFSQEASYLSSPMQEAQKHFLKGKEYSEQGKYLEAEEEFKKAEVLLERFSALDYLKMGSDINQIQELDPQLDPQESLERAQQAAVESNTDLAIELYLEALDSFPNNSDIHYNLAMQYIKNANYWDAVGELEEVINLNPQDPSVYYNLGVIYDGFLDDKETALIYYRKYLELNPEADDSKQVQSWIESLESGKKDER
jgi:tetratricopeptide (TPR) repeat protein